MKENRKYSYPVSMKVTQEQYEKDLKQGLLDLGYIFDSTLNLPWGHREFLITNCAGVNESVSNVSESNIRSNRRYFINHYNPELFLALAGMRGGDQIHVGEFMINKGEPGYLYEKICKITSVDAEDDFYVQESWRKATKEEIINWFTTGRETCKDEELLHTVAVNPQDSYSPSEPSFSTWEYPLTPEEVYIKKSDDVGYKEYENKLSYELDWDFIEAMAKRMQKGGQKYSPYNWKKPLDPEKLKQALFRHTIDIMRGVYNDDGSELGHIEALADNAMMLWYQLKHNKIDE